MADRQYSIHTGETNKFGIIDYVLFAALLVVSASIGLIYAIKDRKRNNTKEFLLAGGNMSAIPVALSLLASFMSAITLLGTPAEMYNYTTMYWWIGPSYFFAVGGAAHIFLPIFYRLRITSAYEVSTCLCLQNKQTQVICFVEENHKNCTSSILVYNLIIHTILNTYVGNFTQLTLATTTTTTTAAIMSIQQHMQQETTVLYPAQD
jgi:hypothetical protein